MPSLAPVPDGLSREARADPRPRLGDIQRGAEVTERARELERVTAFVWKVKNAWQRYGVATVGDVVYVGDEQPAAVLSVAPEDDAE
jgi:hypothetical protein